MKRMLASKRAEVGSIRVSRTGELDGELESLRSGMGTRKELITVYQAGAGAQRWRQRAVETAKSPLLVHPCVGPPAGRVAKLPASSGFLSQVSLQPPDKNT